MKEIRVYAMHLKTDDAYELAVTDNKVFPEIINKYEGHPIIDNGFDRNRQTFVFRNKKSREYAAKEIKEKLNLKYEIEKVPAYVDTKYMEGVN